MYSCPEVSKTPTFTDLNYSPIQDSIIEPSVRKKERHSMGGPHGPAIKQVGCRKTSEALDHPQI